MGSSHAYHAALVNLAHFNSSQLVYTGDKYCTDTAKEIKTEVARMKKVEMRERKIRRSVADSFLWKPSISPEEFQNVYKHKPVDVLESGCHLCAIMLCSMERA